MKTIKIIVKGRVQGVFFRKSTCKQAISLGLKGYVRNLPDGNVEVVAQGDEKRLGNLIAFCRKGPEGALVTDLEITYSEAREEFTGFSIRY